MSQWAPRAPAPCPPPPGRLSLLLIRHPPSVQSLTLSASTLSAHSLTLSPSRPFSSSNRLGLPQILLHPQVARPQFPNWVGPQLVWAQLICSAPNWLARNYAGLCTGVIMFRIAIAGLFRCGLPLDCHWISAYICLSLPKLLLDCHWIVTGYRLDPHWNWNWRHSHKAYIHIAGKPSQSRARDRATWANEHHGGKPRELEPKQSGEAKRVEPKQNDGRPRESEPQ